MNDRIEPCAVCEQPIDIEHEAGFVTTGSLVVHTHHLPRRAESVRADSHTETTSTQGNRA